MGKARLTVGLLVLAAFAIALAVACTKEVIKEVPVEKQVIVEKEVVRVERVEVPVETIIEVEKEVVKTVEVEVPVIVEKEVIREVEVPVQVIVEKEVIVEVEVPGETIIVEKEVVKTVEVEKIVTIIATAVPTVKFTREDLPVPGSALTMAHSSVGPAVYHRPNAHSPWYTAMLNWGIGETLVDYDGQVDSGMIAETWEVDADTVTWHIQRGIPWHDAEYGTVSAIDVQWSFDQANREGTLIPYGQYFTRDFEEDVLMPDSHTLIWNWKTGPVIGYTWLIRHWPQANPIMSKNYYDDVGEEAVNQHITGTGQFKLISHVANDIVNLEGVRNHWLRSPGFATVKILEVPEETTRIAMLQSGQVDALAVSQPQVSTVEEIPGITFVAPRYLAAKGGPVVHFGGNWIMTESDGNPYENTARPDKPWVGGNMGDADFEDARNVRLAMAYAIDREEMLQEIVDGKGCVGYTFGIDTCNARWEERWATPFDVDKAQGLLAEAGYEDGFEVTFWNYSAPDTDMGQSCEAIANYWTKNLGLTVNIDSSAYQIHRPKFINLRSLDFVWCFGAYADLQEPAYYLDLIPDATAGRVLSNLGYDYPESHDLMDRLSVAFDNEDAWDVITEYHDIMGPEGYFFTTNALAFASGGTALGPRIGFSDDMLGLFGQPIDFFTLEPAQ